MFMQGSGIVNQTVVIEKANRKNATHFAIYNDTQLRYLIDLYGGRIRLSQNISTYSKKLGLLMRVIRILPFSLMRIVGLGHFVVAKLHSEVDSCRINTKKQHWNMLVGTYDEKQKVVIQCFNKNDSAVFIKVGNEASEEEMNAEISFLKKRIRYSTFSVPKILDCFRREDGETFNILITNEFCGEKVEPSLNREIVDIYNELSADVKDGLSFSHGDFAPWNIKKDRNGYTLFDWEHCGYRIKGFDLMHYVVMIEIVIYGNNYLEAFDVGLSKIRTFVPDFFIDKEQFLLDFTSMRTQIM